MQHQFKESGQGLPYLGVPACNLLRSSTFQHPLPGKRHRTTILASNARLCIKGSMRPSPPLARGCVNQCHDTLAAADGLSLPDHINPLMAALIACKLEGSIIQQETECHMVASNTWFAIRTLPVKESLDLLHWISFLLILVCTCDNCTPLGIALPIVNPRYLNVVPSGTHAKLAWGCHLGFSCSLNQRPWVLSQLILAPAA